LLVVCELRPTEVIEAQRETLDAIRIEDGCTTRRMGGTEPDPHPALVLNDGAYYEIPSIGFKPHKVGDLVRCHPRTVWLSAEAISTSHADAASSRLHTVAAEAVVPLGPATALLSGTDACCPVAVRHG